MSLLWLKRIYWAWLAKKRQHEKNLYQRKMNPDRKSVPVFVMGNLRSGTTMVFRVLEAHLDVDAYLDNNNAAFEDYYLRGFAPVTRLIDASYASTVVMKPNNEVPLIDKLLTQYPEARILFISRHYSDVIRSSLANTYPFTRLEQDQWRADGRAILEQSLFDLHHFKGLMDPDLLRWCDVHRNGPSPESEVYALHWILYNESLFRTGLDEHDQVMAVCYESLVMSPVSAFERITAFIGISFDPKTVQSVHSRSVRLAVPEDVSEPILGRCEQLYHRLVKTALVN